MRFSRIREVWNLSREGAAHYNTNALKIFVRFWRIKRDLLFPPEEACHLGMADPSLEPDWLVRRFLSKSHLLEIQLRYNPKSHFGLTEDKAVFYTYCRGHGIPHPKVLAIVGPLGGWTDEGHFIHQRENWERFFEERLPERFLVKPSGGCHGDDVSVLIRKGSDFRDNQGVSWTAMQLCDRFLSGSLASRWILQEVLTNHPDIARLTGSEAISTARMITRIDTAGTCRLLFAEFRIIIGRNVVDNISYGKTGNLMSDIDLETGALNQCKSAGTKWGCPDVEAHPDTDVRFKGYRLPDWEEARRLVDGVAPKFLPARLLGWDVAFTPNGPVIIETNACWDPLNEFDSMTVIIEALEKEYRELLEKSSKTATSE
jgi:hypothetical protein